MMFPPTWHFPAAWREEIEVDGVPYVWRVGLTWSAWFPRDATIVVDVVDE